MPFMELFDETLDINSTGNYELSVQFSRDGLYFAIIDSIRNKFVLFRSFEPEENKYFNSENISDILNKDDFLLKRYNKVNVVIPTPRFTMVPAPLFDPGKKDEYYVFNHTKEESDVILSNKLSEPDAYIVFAVTRPVYEIANSFFSGSHPLHHTKPLISQIVHNSKKISGKLIHIHIERDYFNLFIFEKNLLKFSNTFIYRNISDILYFTLNVFKRININQEETIYLSGNTEKYDDLYSGFSMYVRSIEFAEPSGNFTFSYVFNDLGLHKYLNLFIAANCE